MPDRSILDARGAIKIPGWMLAALGLRYGSIIFIEFDEETGEIIARPCRGYTRTILPGGWLTIPAPIRRRLNLREGDILELAIERDEKTGYALKIRLVSPAQNESETPK